MELEEYDYLYKVILVGNSGVGKTNIMLRYTANRFDPATRSTLGIQFSTRTIVASGSKLKIQVWDTAGQEQYQAMVGAYYRGAAGVLIVYDVCDRPSYESIDRWLTEVKKYAPNSRIMLIGNKCDLSDRSVTYEEARTYAQQKSLYYKETSALKNINIIEAFKELLADVHKNVVRTHTARTVMRSIKVVKKRGCCP